MIFTALVGGGCASPGPQQEIDPLKRLAPGRFASPAGNQFGTDTTLESHRAAIVAGQVVSLAELQPGLIESAGAVALEEHALDVLLRARLTRDGRTITDSDIDAERRLLDASLQRAAGVERSDAIPLITTIRDQRGLGPARFQALLERNAMLRVLVRSAGQTSQAPDISNDELETAFDLKFGPRIRARLILVRTLEDAVRARARLATEPFHAVAAELSIDPSSTVGGLLEPLSLADERYPAGLRRLISELDPDQVSDPISVAYTDSSGRPTAQGFAIVRVEERLPLSPSTPTRLDAGPQLREEIQAVRERSAMERLARQTIDSADIRVIDPSLDWAWQRRPRP